ncbi:MAG: hypothetical protein AAGA44_12780 [Pseudomonadota bacterium]
MLSIRSGVNLSMAVLLSVATAPLALADNHNSLEDAGFESQTSGDNGGWRLFQISLYSRNHAHSGEWSMYNGGYSRRMATPPYTIGNDSGGFQEFSARPGSKWRLTGYALSPTKLVGSPAFGLIQLSFFDASGRDLGAVETQDSISKAKLSAEFNSNSPVDEWVQLDTGTATAPEGTALIRAFTIFVDHSASNTSQGVYFDDLVLCEVDDNGDCGNEETP